MQNNIIFETLGKYHETLNIPICITDGEGNVLHSLPVLEKAFLPPQFIKMCIEDFQKQNRDEKHPLILMIEPTYLLGVGKTDPDRYLLIGPASPVLHTAEEIHTASAAFIQPEYLLEYCNTLARTSILPYRRFLNALSVAVYISSQLNISAEDILLSNNAPLQSIPEEDVQERMFAGRESQMVHTPYSFEKRFLEAIRSGNVSLLKRCLLEPISGRVGMMSADPLLQERYLFISINATVTRAAIEGGMPAEEAYTLSDVYCMQMDAMKHIPNINALIYTMMMDFCETVSKYNKRARYSPLVRHCCDYISAHLHEDITLENLSQQEGLSTRTISKAFREDTGVSLTEYIQKLKVEEAKHLLRHSEYSYVEISNYLNYSTQSYFIKIFKDFVGVTPQQYRNENL